MKHIYLYTRRSRHLGDPDDPHLLSAHIAALKLLAAKDGVTIPAANVRTEIGSGESIAGRPTFAALLREWEVLPPGSGGRVYVTEPARLSRGSNQERGRILDALIRARLLVISPERSYDPASPTDELTWSLVQSIDRAEIQRYKQRVAIRRDEMTRQGELTTGLVPWGYRWIRSPGQVGGKKVPGHPEPDPERFPLLVAACREVFTTSIYRLATRYGVPPATLTKCLHNPIICGWPARRSDPHGGTPLPRDQWTWPERAGDYPPACSRETWEQIQVLLATRWRGREKTIAIENGWCRNVVAFSGYPGLVTLASTRQHPGGSRPTYTRYREDGPRLSIDREPVHATATAALAALFAQPARLAGALVALAERRALAPGPAVPDPEAVRQRLATERERLVILKGDLAAPHLDAEDWRALLAAESECKERLGRLKALLEVAPAPIALPDLAPLSGLLAELAENFALVWAELPGDRKQEVTRHLLQEIPVVVGEGGRGRPRSREIGPALYPEWLATLRPPA